jgi:hypothetical protein
MNDIANSSCSEETKAVLRAQAAANLTVGVAGQALSDLGTPTIAGSAAAQVATTAIETSIYVMTEREIRACENPPKE